MPIRPETHASTALYLGLGLRGDKPMDNCAPLPDRLAYCRALPGAWLASYDVMFDRLQKSGAAKGAPVVGDVVLDFALPDAARKLRRLSDLVAEGSVALSFNRG